MLEGRKMNVRAAGNPLRATAEKILSPKTNVPKKISGVAKVIHELEVHQIELEMQNEELRKAQEEVEESRSRYVELYDFAPIESIIGQGTTIRAIWKSS